MIDSFPPVILRYKADWKIQKMICKMAHFKGENRALLLSQGPCLAGKRHEPKISCSQTESAGTTGNPPFFGGMKWCFFLFGEGVCIWIYV